MLKTLHMGKAEKAGLATVFAIVALNIIIDVIRVATNLSPFSASNPNLNAVITMVEPSITVMVCALPSYRSLLSGPRRKSSAAWENSDEVQLNRYRRTNEGDDRSGHSSRSVPETIVEITSKA
ncbi:MAG: hypothetical protein MMC33_007069 [Icmadophila ericetorum]|nr:hypothetical protein [Icmadophila ericetorum]